MGSRRPISAILAVFGGLEIGLRCAGYAGWVCIRCIYDLRRPPGYSLSPQKSVKRIFRGQGLAESGFRVRHDAGVFRPNRRHQRNQNGEKTLKPVSLELSGQNLKIFEAKKLNQRPAKCAMPSQHAPIPNLPRSVPAPPLPAHLCVSTHRCKISPPPRAVLVPGRPFQWKAVEVVLASLFTKRHNATGVY